MREIKTETIIEEVKKLCIKANLYLADDMKQRIDQAEKNEKSALGRQVIGQLVENMKVADENKIPICQDTGMAVFFIKVGQEVHFDGNLTEAINEGVRQ